MFLWSKNMPDLAERLDADWLRYKGRLLSISAGPMICAQAHGRITMGYQHIRVEPISGKVGAEIAGIDLAAPLADDVFAEIRHAFGEHGVVFFRDQHLKPE